MATATIDLDDEEPARPASIPRVLRSPAIRLAQHVHATAIVVMGVAGIAIAIALGLSDHPPDLIDLGICLGFTLPIALGSSAGFHRHFTHRSFKAKLPITETLTSIKSPINR